MKNRIPYLIFVLLVLNACKKPSERKCWKSYGDYTEIERPLDSVNHFKLYKNIKYRLIEDSLSKIVIKGGENMVNQISTELDGYEMSIRNENSCNFLRDSEKIIEVDIHYPSFKRIYVEPSDSVIFPKTLTSDSIFIEIREGGGSILVDVNVTFLRINVSFGTADYTLSGYASNSSIKVQNNGFANALNFSSPYMFIYNNSTNDIQCNIENSDVQINIEATGSVYHTGKASIQDLSIKGTGELIQL